MNDDNDHNVATFEDYDGMILGKAYKLQLHVWKEIKFSEKIYITSMDKVMKYISGHSYEVQKGGCHVC